jgi:hypothetical protein
MTRLLRLLMISLLTIATACSACTGRNPPSDVSSDCVATFDVRSRAQPLGRDSAFRLAVQEKASQPGTYRLRELTDAAGWTTEWDRVAVLKTGITTEALNSAAGLPGYCWNSLPKFSGSDGGVDYFYVFIGGSEPKQAVRAIEPMGIFRGFRSGDILLPDTEFRSVQPPPVQQAPYLESVQN